VVSVTPWPRFTPGERTPGTPGAGLDAGARRKIRPYWGSNLDRPIESRTVCFLNIHLIIFCDLCRNPTKGMIINRPNGSDVYEGVLKDYIGEVQLFLIKLVIYLNI
jgi:hypothetical protein